MQKKRIAGIYLSYIECYLKISAQKKINFTDINYIYQQHHVERT